MLKIDLDRNKQEASIGFRGSMQEILSDLASAVHVIHVRLCKKDLFAGLEFEKTIRDPEFWNLVLKPSEEDSAISELEGKNND